MGTPRYFPKFLEEEMQSSFSILSILEGEVCGKKKNFDLARFIF